MARPLRLELAGALYHITSRGDRRHGLAGHLFQRRYKSILVQNEAYLLELSRYVVLNPLRAKMVKRAENWPRSSYPAHLGKVECPEWLDSDCLLRQFAKRRSTAIERYRAFVEQGKGISSPREPLIKSCSGTQCAKITLDALQI